MNNLILSFASLNILLEFEAEGFARPLKKILVTEIQNQYKSLIIKSSKKIDYKIIFKESNIINQVKLKEQFYAEFYSKLDRSTYKTFFHISLVQFQLLLHTILHEHSLHSSMFLLHSSGNSINNKASLFLGKSGSGKSTISAMLASKYKSIAEDSVIIDKSMSEFIAYQTPFVEKTLIRKKQRKLELGGIFFLLKSNKYQINKITEKNTIIKLLLENTIIENKKNISIYIKKIYEFAHFYNDFYFIEFGLNKKKLLELF